MELFLLVQKRKGIRIWMMVPRQEKIVAKKILKSHKI